MDKITTMTRYRRDVVSLVFNLVAMVITWLLTFGVGRLVFIGINSGKAADVPMSLIGQALAHGIVFDVSIWGYCGILACVAFAIAIWFESEKNDE